LRFRYFTSSRGSMNWRHASAHRIVPKRPARFVATCHRSGTLKWFRVESIFDARMDGREPFRIAIEEEVAAYVAQSVDGFNPGGPAATLAKREVNSRPWWRGHRSTARLPDPTRSCRGTLREETYRRNGPLPARASTLAGLRRILSKLSRDVNSGSGASRGS